MRFNPEHCPRGAYTSDPVRIQTPASVLAAASNVDPFLSNLYNAIFMYAVPRHLSLALLVLNFHQSTSPHLRNTLCEKFHWFSQEPTMLYKPLSRGHWCRSMLDLGDIRPSDALTEQVDCSPWANKATVLYGPGI